MKLRLATYNIHKGFSHFNRRMMVHELRHHLRLLDVDIVFLQEVQGEHEHHARQSTTGRRAAVRVSRRRGVADYAYGRNAIYDHGHHGNAILSRFPIISAENQDVSAHRFEQRGLLHCEVALGELHLHCLCVHFGLNERGRRRQLSALTERVQRLVPAGAPLVVAGDFNDWRNSAGRKLVAELGLREVFRDQRGRPARTYPEHLSAAAPGPHLRARFRRAPRRSAPWPALVAHLRSCRAERRTGTAMTLEFLGGNKLQLLVNGSAYFPALQQAFDAAQSEIYLETYIFADDDTGRRIAAALVRAAGRGVSVHVLVDGFGSKGMFEQTRQLLSAANIEVLIFGPKTSPLTLRRNRLRRLHRKLVVVDARVAFVGGINIIDDMHTPAAYAAALRLCRAHRGAADRERPGADRAPVAPGRLGESQAQRAAASAGRVPPRAAISAPCWWCATICAIDPTSRMPISPQSPRRARRSSSPTPISSPARASAMRCAARPGAACA